jgi:hypothetical protein
VLPYTWNYTPPLAASGPSEPGRPHRGRERLRDAPLRGRPATRHVPSGSLPGRVPGTVDLVGVATAIPATRLISVQAKPRALLEFNIAVVSVTDDELFVGCEHGEIGVEVPLTACIALAVQDDAFDALRAVVRFDAHEGVG